MSLPSQFPAQVCAERCETCIFGPNSPITRERFAELAASWAKMRGGHQICHQHGTSEGGSDVWCRGFYETQVPEWLRAEFERSGFVVAVAEAPR